MTEAPAVLGFWRRVNNGDDRLGLLRHYSDVVIERPPEWSKARVRAEVVRDATPLECFCCRHRDRVIHWHHVIQVQNGGSNHGLNLVGVCELCHARVHPWLPKRVTSRWRWLSLGELMRRAKDYVTRKQAER